MVGFKLMDILKSLSLSLVYFSKLALLLVIVYFWDRPFPKLTVTLRRVLALAISFRWHVTSPDTLTIIGSPRISSNILLNI